MFCFEICQLSLTFALTTFCNLKMSIFWLGRNKFTSFGMPLAGTFALILLVHNCFGRSAIPLAGTNAIVFLFPQSWPQVLPLSLPATKPEKSGFLSCAGGFAIPSAAVLSQFGPKSNYLSLNYLDTFNIYLYTIVDGLWYQGHTGLVPEVSYICSMVYIVVSITFGPYGLYIWPSCHNEWDSLVGILSLL